MQKIQVSRDVEHKKMLIDGRMVYKCHYLEFIGPL